MCSHCAFCFLHHFIFKLLALLYRQGSWELKDDVIEVCWTQQNSFICSLCCSTSPKSGKKAARFWHIAGDFETLQHIKYYSKWRDTKTPSLWSLSWKRALSWESRNRSNGCIGLPHSCSEKLLILSSITEDAKDLLFKWVIPADICCVKN